MYLATLEVERRGVHRRGGRSRLAMTDGMRVVGIKRTMKMEMHRS